MNHFKLTILGCSAAMPNKHHRPSAQVLNYNDAYYICDAGECLQYGLYEAHISVTKVRAIFITHMHGDHMLGLIGYLMMLSVAGRKEDMHIYGPVGLEEYIKNQMEVICPNIGYKIYFHSVEKEETVYLDNYLTVDSVRLNHKDLDCFGYVFRTYDQLSTHINIDALNKAGIPKTCIKEIKELYTKDIDGTFTYEGKDYLLSELCTREFKPGISFAYITDNSFERVINGETKEYGSLVAYSPLVDKLKNIDLLYHETSYLWKDVDKAIMYGHATAAEVGLLAKTANIRSVLIGHISARYAKEEWLRDECIENGVSDVILADEQMKLAFDNEHTERIY